MDEETTQGNGDLAPVVGAGAAAPEAAPQTAEGGAAKDPVQEAIDRLRREYEGPGGHIAKLKSERDKARKALEQREAQERQRAVETMRQAQIVAQQDPERAYQMLSTQTEAMLRQEQQSRGQQEWHEWVQSTASDLELLTGDADADAKAWAEIDALGQRVWAENGPESAPFVFQGELAKRAKDRQKEARVKAEKEKEQALATIPEQVKREVVRALAAAGYTEADTSLPGKPAGQEDELMKLSPSVRIATILKRERQQGK